MEPSTMRLIDHFPCFELHALLRFCKINYQYQYSYSPIALGRKLPILIYEKKIYDYDEAMNMLSTKFLKESLDVDQIMMDNLLASYLCNHLNGSIGKLEKLSHEKRNLYFHRLPLGMNIAYSSFQSLKSFFSFEDDIAYSGYRNDQLLEQLKQSYQELDIFFEEDMHLSIRSHFIQNFTQERNHDVMNILGKADAILFGHIAKALNNPKTIPIVKEFPGLLLYFNLICDEYFGTFSNDENESIAWISATYTLITNPFVRKSSEDLIRYLLISEENFKEIESIHLIDKLHIYEDPEAKDEKTEFSTFVINKEILNPFQRLQDVYNNEIPITLGGFALTGFVGVCFLSYFYSKFKH